MLCISQTLLGNECCLWIITRQLLEVIRSSPLAELYVLLVFLWLGVYYPTPDLEQYSPYYLTSIQGEKKKKQKTRHCKICLTLAWAHRGVFIHVGIKSSKEWGSIFPLTSNLYHSMLKCSICIYFGVPEIFTIIFHNTLLLRG